MRSLSRSVLAGCIVAALSDGDAAAAASRMPSGSTYVVTSCDDSGPGTLRDALAALQDFGIVDMTGLTCSVITLTSGELSTSADTVYITGNGATVTAANASRVLAHHGTQRLTITNLDIRDGEVSATPIALGGCIYSEGDVTLGNVTVAGCLVTSTGMNNATVAEGAGVFSRGFVSLAGSVVRDNTAIPAAVTYNYARGAGIYADAIALDKSTITGNSIAGSGVYTSGGGFSVRGDAYIRYSTIDGNSAYLGGGGETGVGGASYIRNSTISGNGGGGLLSRDSLLEVRNSTITANTFPTTRLDGHGAWRDGAGLWLLGNHPYLALRSSIVAGNTAGGVADDIDVQFWYSQIIGSNSIVIASNIPPPSDTIRDDPMLAPLADNGGPTRTHALVLGSPAIDRGRNPDRDAYDQRGAGYLRTIGVATDIGAYELQVAQPPPDPIFANGFN